MRNIENVVEELKNKAYSKSDWDVQNFQDILFPLLDEILEIHNEELIANEDIISRKSVKKNLDCKIDFGSSENRLRVLNIIDDEPPAYIENITEKDTDLER